MTTEITHKIAEYTVELDTEGDTTQCFITFKKYGASLAALSDLGYLTHQDQHRLHFVPVRTIDRIEKWAELNGY